MILAERIKEHSENLLNMQTEIERFFNVVEAATGKARQNLLLYQQLKQQAAKALDDVSEGYRAALSLYGQSEEFWQKMLRFRDEHNELSYEAVALRRTDPDNAEKIIDKLKAAREKLKQLYAEVEQIRKENIPADDDNELPDGDL